MTKLFFVILFWINKKLLFFRQAERLVFVIISLKKERKWR
jgi:hypothetical protein